MTFHSSLKSGALALVSLIIFFVGQAVAMAGTTAPYSAKDQAISELGITACGDFAQPQTGLVFYVCSPLHWVMNATFVLYGALIMFATVAVLRRIWPGRKLRKAGLLLVFFGGIEAVASGFSPLDVVPFFHSLSGGLAIAALNIGLLLLGFAAIRQHRALGAWTLAAGIIGVIGFLMSGTPPYSGLGYGGWERVAGSAFAVWGVGLGLRLLVQQKSNGKLGRTA